MQSDSLLLLQNHRAYATLFSHSFTVLLSLQSIPERFIAFLQVITTARTPLTLLSLCGKSSF